MNFLLPTIILGVAIVMVVVQVYEAVQIRMVQDVLYSRPGKTEMAKEKKETMYDLENALKVRRVKRK